MKYVCRCRMCKAEFEVDASYETKEEALDSLKDRPAFFLHEHLRSSVWGLGEIIGIRERVQSASFRASPAQDG